MWAIWQSYLDKTKWRKKTISFDKRFHPNFKFEPFFTLSASNILPNSHFVTTKNHYSIRDLTKISCAFIYKLNRTKKSNQNIQTKKNEFIQLDVKTFYRWYVLITHLWHEASNHGWLAFQSAKWSCREINECAVAAATWMGATWFAWPRRVNRRDWNRK